MLFRIGATALLVGLACADASHDQTDDEMFRQWEKDFQKNYLSKQDREKAFSTWKQNAIFVSDLNKQGLSWKASIHTKYADLTPEEFQSTILIKNKFDNDHFHHTVMKNSTTLDEKMMKTKPKSAETAFDWREHGAVTKVQDQGSAGTCWAFSTIGNIEGQWFLSGNSLTDLSEEYLVDCDGTTDEENGHADCSIFGGWPYLAYQFVMDTQGVPSEEDYPYCAGSGGCYPCMKGPVSLCGPPPYPTCDKNFQECSLPSSYDMLGRISDWTAVARDESTIADTLVNVGPLSALLDATQLQFYDSGIWDGYVSNPKLGCSKTHLNHAVLLVGYGTDAGNDYWVVKNSWGESFGEEGYFRIARGDGTCGINTAVTSSLIK